MRLTTTLQIPEAPTNINGVIAINSAFENTDVNDVQDTKGLHNTYQAITAAYPPGYDACGQNSQQWCSFQSTYLTDHTPPQMTAKPYVKGPGTVALQWRYYPDRKKILQTADNNGVLMDVKEAPIQFWPKTECQCQANGTIKAHSYIDTTFTLEKPVPDWGNFVAANRARTPKPPVSPDGGTTWLIERIDIDDSYCNNIEKCPEVTPDKEQPAKWGLGAPNPMKENFRAEVMDGTAKPVHDGVGEFLAVNEHLKRDVSATGAPARRRKTAP